MNFGLGICKRKLGKKGIGVIIAGALLILLVLSSVGIIWYFISAFVGKSSSGIQTDCFSVDLEPLKCETYGICSYKAGAPYYKADVLIKRNSGRGELTGLRFVFEAVNKRAFVTDKEVSGFNELETISYTGNNKIIVTDIEPVKLNIVSIVSREKNACGKYSNEISCINIQPAPVLGQTPGQGPESNYCCQYPWNLTECSPPTSPLELGKTYCCNKVPQGFTGSGDNCIYNPNINQPSNCCPTGYCY